VCLVPKIVALKMDISTAVAMSPYGSLFCPFRLVSYASPFAIYAPSERTIHQSQIKLIIIRIQSRATARIMQFPLLLVALALAIVNTIAQTVTPFTLDGPLEEYGMKLFKTPDVAC
jgi:hypothetical protein